MEKNTGIHIVSSTKPWSAVSVLRSQQSIRHSRYSQHVMEQEGSLQCSEKTAIGFYPEPDKSSPYSLFYFGKIDFNIIIPHRSTNKQTPWLESVSEPCRPSESRLSAKLVPTFADIGCRVVSVTGLRGI
jgi:hypothetical protein